MRVNLRPVANTQMEPTRRDGARLICHVMPTQNQMKMRAANDGFESLAAAVNASMPSCRLLVLEEHGDAAFALFDAHPNGPAYLYEVHFARRGGRWSEGSSGNGCGWTLVDEAANVGVLTDWGEAPEGADRVRSELGEERVEKNVVDGVFAVAWWDVPREPRLPLLTSYRVCGRWISEQE